MPSAFTHSSSSLISCFVRGQINIARAWIIILVFLPRVDSTLQFLGGRVWLSVLPRICWGIVLFPLGRLILGCMVLEGIWILASYTFLAVFSWSEFGFVAFWAVDFFFAFDG